MTAWTLARPPHCFQPPQPSLLTAVGFLQPQQSESIMEKGGSRGLAGVQPSWLPSCSLNVSSQAFKGLRELSAQESKQVLRLACSKLAQAHEERKQKIG